MTRDQLLAQAADADRQADAIFERMHQASTSAAADPRGGQPHVPAGWSARAQDASDLRRKAEWLRAEAAELVPAKVLASVALALTPPPSPTICRATAAPPAQPEPEPDPVEAMVDRIIKA